MLKNKYGVYEKRNMWNVNDSSTGNYAEWRAMYSEGRTEVVGFIALIVASQGVGMGACEIGQVLAKLIKSSQRANLSVVKTEKLSIIYTTAKDYLK